MTTDTQGAPPPTVPPATHPVDSDEFRVVAGHLASGVAVVTTQTSGTRFGMTASSVTSLSLDPPLMLVCLNSAMPTAQAVAEAGAYAVNVLDRQSAHLAHRFASAQEDKFAGVATSPGASAAPTLDGALAHIECQVIEQITGGTHTIFIGRVVAATARDGEPLTYFRGGFGRFELERDERVYLTLRTHLTQRRWEADSALDVDQVAFELDLARSSCFYAMTRLSSEGMLRREQGRGYVVVPFDVTDSDQAFDARSAIEVGALHLVDLPLPEATLRELGSLFTAMARFLVDDRFVDFDGYLDANDAFHRALVALAGSSALSAAFEQIGLRSVMASSFGATPGTSQRFVEVQREILLALEAGDRARAQTGVLTYAALAKQRAREILERTGGVL
ncbi:MAG TPA: flavin reductase [Nocardioides sp.]|uniref:flavin reductase n=1 Tax=Nocardioides sp. TaxID=35761 RepID=UPI002CE040AB|nr:flavin reductase [Nocardioides sp.]HTW16657.1 flavin reductase [Nocardioides sp.]